MTNISRRGEGITRKESGYLRAFRLDRVKLLSKEETAAQIATKNPDAIRAIKRLFDSAWAFPMRMR